MRKQYGGPLIAVHWLTVLLIIATFVLAQMLQDMTLSPLKLKLYSWHKWLGMTVLFLVPLRLLLRFIDRFDHRSGLSLLEIRASATVHSLIYLLLICVPMLGWLHSSAAGFPVVWFGVLPLPDLVGKEKAIAETFKALHSGAVNALVVLIALHASAALYHHYIKRDGVLARMLPWLSVKT
jgi:cytochrome b561